MTAQSQKTNEFSNIPATQMVPTQTGENIWYDNIEVLQLFPCRKTAQPAWRLLTNYNHLL